MLKKKKKKKTFWFCLCHSYFLVWVEEKITRFPLAYFITFYCTLSVPPTPWLWHLHSSSPFHHLTRLTWLWFARWKESACLPFEKFISEAPHLALNLIGLIVWCIRLLYFLFVGFCFIYIYSKRLKPLTITKPYPFWMWRLSCETLGGTLHIWWLDGAHTLLTGSRNLGLS